MYFEPPNLTAMFNRLIANGVKNIVSDKDYLQNEIAKWKSSAKRIEQITGDRYYNGFHDILQRQRTAIGEGGKLTAIDNLPNNRIVDNQYEKVVTQKVNFFVGQPISFQCENEKYVELLGNIFDKSFLRILKALCVDCLNGGIAWLYVFYDDEGNFCFKRFPPFEILPFWKDSEHTKLDYAVRVYQVQEYVGRTENIIEKVEIYRQDGIEYYTLNDGVLIPDIEKPKENYLQLNKQCFNWSKIPLIPFKYNYLEIPLIRNLKSMQDAINTTLSDFENNMQEDARNTVLILRGYEGENLGEFRKNLATYGVVKVREDGGGVETLQVEVNVENYKSFIALLKKEFVEIAKAYNAEELRSGNTPNEMNIKSIFNDINMDANAMEIEFEASFQNLLWFINAHLANTAQGNFDDAKVDIIFNKDTIVNESQVITDIKNSVGIISNKTAVANHPWVEDVNTELEQLEQEKQAEIDYYAQSMTGKIDEKSGILA